MDFVSEGLHQACCLSAIRTRLVTLVLALMLVIPTGAAAGSPGTQKNIHLNPGIETGLTIHHRGGGFGSTLGLRLSANDVLHYMVPVKWEGVYGHVQRDFSHERWLSGLGYGVGYLFLGLEAGVAIHVDDRDTHLGAEAAVVGTLGVVGIHVRHTRFFEQPAVTEIGLRGHWPLKVPRRGTK